QIFLNEDPPMRIWMTPRTGKDEHFAMVTTLTSGIDSAAAFERFSKKGFFASWFRKAEKKRTLTSAGNMLSHIENPYKDQVILISDAVWCAEAEMTGAVISGWKAANAVTYALVEGKISREGIKSYLDWWREEVIEKYNDQDMMRNVALPYVLTPDEIDFMFSLIKEPLPSIFDPYETPKLIAGALAEVMPIIAKERPAMFQKLSEMGSIPLRKVFEGCIRAGFPSRVLC
ncbi:MAG: hypothetical protein KAJ08_03720, partial [Deltaproteobacteria bacterium]|nr:hypothetical protein [Deltaproteobacteria bacterium]